MGRGFYSVDSLSGIFALVMDTEKDRRNLLSGILRYCGALVTPVETPDAALAVMQLLKPDVVVVDFSDPENGPLRFIRCVRAMPPDEGGVVPTVAIGDEGANASLARTLGFDSYLLKPIDPWGLCQVVSDLIAR